jgi:hypothetical protein
MSDDFDPWGNFGDDEEPIIAAHGELTAVPYACAACGETNETQLDLSGGLHQQYTEDCAVCCRPNLIEIFVDEETLAVTITNELEYD